MNPRGLEQRIQGRIELFLSRGSDIFMFAQSPSFPRTSLHKDKARDCICAHVTNTEHTHTHTDMECE